MIPFSVYAIILIIIAFAGGYQLGKRGGVKGGILFNESDASDQARDSAGKAVQARIAKRKSRIMALAKSEGKITNNDVEDMFCISDATARNYLNGLEQAQQLTQVGITGRGVHYIPVPQN